MADCVKGNARSTAIAVLYQDYESEAGLRE